MVSRGRTIDCRHCFDGMCIRVGVGCYSSDYWAKWTQLPSNLGFHGSQIDFQPRQTQYRIMSYFLGTGLWNSASISFTSVPSAAIPHVLPFSCAWTICIKGPFIPKYHWHSQKGSGLRPFSLGRLYMSLGKLSYIF